MKLLQVNIWQGRLLKSFVDLVKEINPDIITLQEVCNCEEKDLSPFNFNNLESIKADYLMNNEAFAPVFSFPFMKYQIFFGNAVLSKFPITDKNFVFTNLDFKEDFDARYDDYNIRNFVHTTIDINGSKLNVVTHHGYHIDGTKEGNEETERQMIIVRDYIKTLNGPVILTGDFNLSPRCRSLEILNEELDNLCVLNNIQTTRNNIAKTSQQVCDYIFTNDRVKVNKFEVRDEVVSDHRALLLDFDV